MGHVIDGFPAAPELSKLRLEYKPEGPSTAMVVVFSRIPQYGGQMKHGGKQHKHQDNQKSF